MGTKISTKKKDSDPASRSKFTHIRGEPINRKDKQWVGFVEKYSVYSKRMPSDYLDNSKISKVALPIDHGFDFRPDPMDKAFNYRFFEQLLIQAAALFDRCLIYRGERDEFAAKSANLSLEFEEFDRIDRIHDEEIKSGSYAIDYEQSSREWKACAEDQKAIETRQKESDKVTKTYISGPKATTALQAAKRAAWFSGVPAILNHGQNWYYSGEPWPTSSDKAHRVSHNLQLSAEELHKYNIDFQWAEKMANAAVRTHELEAAKWRRASMSYKSDWDNRQLRFKSQRNQVAKDLAKYKISLTTNGGPLDYSRREQRASLLFERDYRDAISRLVPAAIGMHTLLGYAIALPDTVRKLLSTEIERDLIESSSRAGLEIYPTITTADNSLSFDDAIHWLREAVAWLIRYQQGELKYAEAYGLKHLVHNELDLEGHEGIKFKLGESLFPHLQDVRLVSIGVELGGDIYGYYRATIVPPQEMYVIGASGKKRNLPIIKNPIIVLGRACKCDLIKYQQVEKSNAVYNMSPFGGEWTLELSPQSTHGEPKKLIASVVLHIEYTAYTV